MFEPYNILFITITMSISTILSKYPIKITPNSGLDIIGRANNIYQVLTHIIFAYQVITLKDNDTIYGGHDKQQLTEFVIASAIDYYGWITIFSRIRKPSYTAKILANTHIATIIMAIIDFETFQTLYIRATDERFLTITRATFLLTDSLVRGYYQFVVL